MKFWAVGYGEWVEIQQGYNPPKAIKSEVQRGVVKRKIVTDQVYVDAAGYSHYRIKTVEVPTIIKSTVFVGCTPVCCVHYNRFYQLVSRMVPKDIVTPISEEEAKIVMDWKSAA